MELGSELRRSPRLALWWQPVGPSGSLQEAQPSWPVIRRLLGPTPRPVSFGALREEHYESRLPGTLLGRASLPLAAAEAGVVSPCHSSPFLLGFFRRKGASEG